MTNLISNRPCSIAGLLSAVFDYTFEESYVRCGLLLCPICNKAGRNPAYYPYCNEKHWCKNERDQRTWTTLICETCGISFRRYVSRIENSLRHRERLGARGSIGFFCSRTCYGRWFGKNYGRGKQPLKTHCKYGHSLEDAYLSTFKGRTQRHCRVCGKNRYRKRRTASEADPTDPTTWRPG